MRIDRIDVRTSGSALQLHPRMTVLSAPGSAARRAVVDVFRTIGGERDLSISGVIDVNGVRLQIDDRTVDQLMLDLPVSPIVRAPSSSTEDPGSGVDLRSLLRSAATEREDLDRAIVAEREHLDPFAGAALDAAIGRVDALEAQRNALRSEHERVVAQRRRAEDQRSGQRAGVVWIEAVLAAIDPAALDAASQRLERARAAGDLAARRAAVEAKRVVAEAALLTAEGSLDTALAEGERHRADPEVVRRLEAVRDEIFAGDDRSGPGRVIRDKRRVAELRAEEAVLLDRLGFDTYSAYVMGAPSTAGSPGSAGPDLTALRAAVAQAREALEGHRSDAEALDREIDRIDVEHLDTIAAAVAAAVEPARPAPGDGTWVSDRWPDAVGAPPQPPPVPEVGDGAVAMAAGVERWQEWHRSTAEWVVGAGAALEADLVTDEGPAQSRQAWAALEQEIDTALDVLGSAQERVRLHEAAADSIATLRDRQLSLRDRERDLLERIAGESAATPSAHRASTDLSSPAGGPTEEWRVIETLALLRAVSFVGSVPVLVDGVTDDAEQRRAVLDRLDAMSDLIQVVVLTDDRSVADVAAAYGDRVAVI